MTRRALGYALAIPAWAVQPVLFPVALWGAYQVQAWNRWMNTMLAAYGADTDQEGTGQ